MKIQKICTIILSVVFLSSFSISNGQDAASSPSTGATVTEEVDEEEENKFSFSGSVDAYYHTSFGREEDAPGTSFANLPGFGLGMVNLIGGYTHGKLGVVADLVFGPRGYDAVFNNMYTDQHIVNQLLISYQVTPSFALNLGQFNTFLGYEVISPTLNFHYSTSYMFSYGPFSHTGLRADFSFENGFLAKAAIMNATDHVEFDDVQSFTFGAQLGYANDNGGVYLNFLYGDQDGALKNVDPDNDGTSEGNTFQADITGGWNFGEKFYLGVNATVRSVAVGEEFDVNDDIIKSSGKKKGFSGLALYPKVQVSENLGIGVRAEYFAVMNNYINPMGLDDNGDGSIIDLTASLNYTIGNLTIIPEFRIDVASEDSFTKKDATDGMKNLSTLNIAAVFKF